MDSFWATLIGVLGALTTIGSVAVLAIKSRGENKVAAMNAKTALDERIDERVAEQLKSAWAEIDNLKQEFKNLQTKTNRRDGAITRILRAIANQWPGPNGPDLDPADIAEIEETVPAQWIRNKLNQRRGENDDSS